MKKISLFCVALLLSFFASAQDQLFKTDNTKILVKVLEVGPDDIKFRYFNEPQGPIYVESKKNVTLIIYQSGEHQVFKHAPDAPAPAASAPRPRKRLSEMTAPDSMIIYRHENNLAINFLYFFNNEVGFTYRREFFKSHFNIVVPVAFGVSDPGVTQNVYFNTAPVRIILNKKNFETGLGVHYYPTVSTKTNFYIGPMFRYMQYFITQEALGWPNYMIASNNSVLSRYAISITNGLICRTRSRLTTNLFISLGFKNDQVRDPLRDKGGQLVTTLPSPMSLYWWSGFEVGFNF